MNLTGKIETNVGPSLSGDDVIIDVKVTDENGKVSYKKRLIVSPEDYDFIAADFDSALIRVKEVFLAHSVVNGCYDEFDRTNHYA